MSILVHDLAFARPGDKGDDVDISVFARSAEAYDVLAAQLTSEVVRDQYGALVRGDVSRHEVPKVLALKFVLRDALGGGGPSSLRADNLGKSLAGVLLRLHLDLPEDVEVALRRSIPQIEVPMDPYDGAQWVVRD